MTDLAPPDDLVAGLRSRIEGEVLTAGAKGYDRARQPHFAARSGRPVAVVRPRHSVDVARVVEHARESGVPLFVRGGGHHAAGHSTGDGLLLDLGSLDRLAVDAESATAWVGSGLTAGDVTRALSPYGLAVGFGDTGTVGIGGLTLGGGIGFLSRLHGMTIDNLLAAEIVTADGQVRVVDREREPDLYWAIRGGGGNFGVATRFHFQLAAVSNVYGGVLLLPATAAALARLIDVCTAADDALTVIATIMALPPLPQLPKDLHGQLAIMARVCWAGDQNRAMEQIRPLQTVAPPLADMLGPIPYPALLEEAPPSARQVMTVRNQYADTVDERLGETVIDHLGRTDAWLRMVQFRVLGGAIARVAPDATAYAHRRSRVMVNIARNVEGDVEEARQWTEMLGTALQQTDTGSYVNFFGPHDATRIGSAYPPETLARLRQIKSAYDPTNLFRHNDNISPAPDEFA